jgi:hypothetical protein
MQSKACILTRLLALIAMMTLGATVSFHTPSDFRMGACIIVSLAAATVVVCSLCNGKFMWTLLFMGVLGMFTPFHRTQFSHLVISILDMATLVLFAASPIILGKSTRPFVLKDP